MLTDLSFLRQELKAKRGYRKSLLQELRDVKTPKTRKHIDALEKRIGDLEAQIVRLRLTQDRLKREREYILRNREAMRNKIGYVDKEIGGLRFLIGIVREDGKRNASQSLQRREIMGTGRAATLRWLVRFGDAIERQDTKTADRMKLELIQAILSKDSFVGTIEPWDKWCSAIDSVKFEATL